jgi:hypothetical protein
MFTRIGRVTVGLLTAALIATAPIACSRGSVDDGEAAATTVAPTTTEATTTTGEPTPTATTPSTDTSPTTPPPDDGTDAFGNTPEQSAQFRAAYRAAFETECARIWATYAGGDGILADPDFPEDPYVVDDCVIDLDDSWGEFAASVEEAQATGTDDAQIAASDLADPLCDSSGTRCFSY